MKKWLLCLFVLLCLTCCVYAEETVQIDWSRPVIALTFDDGPSQYTAEIVQLLEEYDCRATFFMLGNRMDAYSDAVQAVVQSNNEIGTHTFAHENLAEAAGSRVYNTLKNGVQKIVEDTGRTVRYLRPPYGAVGGDTYIHSKKLELVIIIWSLDSLDWQAETPEMIADKILSDVQSGDIILCHDTKEVTLQAMKTVLPELVERGYQLVTVSELFSGYSEELQYNAKYSRLHLDRVDVHK